MNKVILSFVGVAIIIAGVAFWGGATYAKAGTPARGTFTAGQFTPGATGGAGVRGVRTGMGSATIGQVITKDATSVTVKMPDGSTKIVLISDSTVVSKTVTGTLADVAVGTNVAVSGPANADGSVTAANIQLRPATTTPPTR
jgi:hypothetical protein